MLKQERYTDTEYANIYQFAAQHDNLQGMTEIQDHQKFFGKRVKVVRGRKLTVGTIGEVFYLSRKHYGKNRWFGFSTRVGIKTGGGEVFWTSTDNIELCSEVAK